MRNTHIYYYRGNAYEIIEGEDLFTDQRYMYITGVSPDATREDIRVVAVAVNTYAHNQGFSDLSIVEFLDKMLQEN